MPDTPNLHLPYPALSDTPDVPRDIGALAAAVEAAILTMDTAVWAKWIGTTTWAPTAFNQWQASPATTGPVTPPRSGLAVGLFTFTVRTAAEDYWRPACTGGQLLSQPSFHSTGQVTVPITMPAIAKVTAGQPFTLTIEGRRLGQTGGLIDLFDVAVTTILLGSPTVAGPLTLPAPPPDQP